MTHIQTHTSPLGMANDGVATPAIVSLLNFILADEGSRQSKSRLQSTQC